MEDIRKSLLGVEVLEGIHFELKSGEIGSLAGTNGAGKSTLSNVIMGIYRRDSGEMWIMEKRLIFGSAKDAEKCSIEMTSGTYILNNMKVLETFFLDDGLIRKGLSWMQRSGRKPQNPGFYRI